MYRTDEALMEEYSKAMDAIKALNMEYRSLKRSTAYVTGQKILNIKTDGITILMRKLFNRMSSDYWKQNKILSSFKDLPTASNDRTNCNYFLNDKIAVYTCIIGGYDELQEPMIHPNNIDYYAITDFDIPLTSKWKRIDPNSFEGISEYNAPLKNRYFKMFPHIVFPNYKYSVYVDGNFRIYTDFTEHVNRLSDYGFAHFRHHKRTSVLQEAEACKILKKEKPETIDKYIEKLRLNGFPDNYGLIACDIIVREHNKESCVKVMEQWWVEFRDFVRRDQLSLPYVLYKNGIAIDEVATLGGNVHQDYSFEIMKHKKYR